MSFSKYIFPMLVASTVLAAPASAYTDEIDCPTHGMAMYFTGQTKFEGATMYELYRCSMGDAWWLPVAPASVFPAQNPNPNQNFYVKPTYSTIDHPCPVCGQATYSTGQTEFVNFKLAWVRRCLNNHESVWTSSQ